MGTDSDATRSRPPEVVDADATRSRPPEVESARVATTVSAGDTFVDEPERYAIAGQIGAGGMGTVLAAQGSRLGRPVALKVVTADREDLRRRFEREAQITARLQHPAIVPVYGSGRGQNGQPFYAMKHVTGEPLDKVIAKTESLTDRIALLPKVIAVTEAIAYAHAERVIHRDLKPANILVGGFGETVVIDWGLAKDLGRTDDEAESVSPYRASADETAHGKVMGTPAYMALEQARGDAVDERADVFALGAILYHVLAGVAPYRRRDEGSVPWESMLARVLADAPEPLDAVAPGVPPELVTIVQRAMARHAKDRYATAGELAQDLRRFQTGQLVGAHRYSTWQLVKRWARRHRGVLAVSGLAIVVIAVLSALGIDRIVSERDRAEANQTIAEQNSAKAENLVDFMMTDLQPRLKEIGKLALFDVVANRVVSYYEQGAMIDDDQRRRYATAVTSQGHVAAAQGNTAAATQSLTRALALLQPLVERDRRGTALNQTYYQVKDELALMQGNRGDVKGALAAWAQLRAELAAIPPPLPAWAAKDIAIAWHRTGAFYETAGDVANAATAFAKAIEGYRESLGDPEPERQFNVAIALDRHAFMLLRLGDVKRAQAEVNEADAILDKLVASAPQNTEYLSAKGASAFKRGQLADAMQDWRAGLAAFDQARQVFGKLNALDPSNLDNADKLASTISKVSDEYENLNDKPNRDAMIAKYVEIAEATSRADPNNDDFARSLSLAHMRSANTKLADHPKDALAEYQLILAKNEIRLAKTNKYSIHTDNAFLWQQIGKIQGDAGDVAAAQASMQRSIDEVALAVAAQPKNLEWQHDLMVRRFTLFRFLDKHGRAKEALALARTAAAEYEAVMSSTAPLDNRHDASSLWQMVAELEERAHALDDAVRDMRHAVTLCDALAAEAPTVKDIVDDDHEERGVLARMLAATGHVDESKRLLVETLAQVDATKAPKIAAALSQQLAGLR